MSTPPSIELVGPPTPSASRVLTPDALAFVGELEREFGARRRELLARRAARRTALRAGALPEFRAETAAIREGDWKVAVPPADLLNRRVEITGPPTAKMVVNALNSGANVFMADFEDAMAPSWLGVVEGQAVVADAVRRTLAFTSPEGKSYRLDEQLATLVVRPRGWHLPENRARLEGEPLSASLWDFGLFAFHNAAELLERGSGPYLYLPKMEAALEAALWNDVFAYAEQRLRLPLASIRATVLIETIHAAFEMDEILHALRERSAGLNAGRWDYIFSVIKAFPQRPEFVLPDRAQVTMTVPFMRAYSQLLVRTCHRRGAHAIGGMAAFLPSRRDPAANETALARVREDKLRESRDGFDGTWVAHPDLVELAREVFDEALGGRPHQHHRLREDVRVAAADLLDVRVPGGSVSEEGMRRNVRVALAYLHSWLGGSGAVAIDQLMEDTATAEISRAQLWQWIRHGTPLDEGGVATRELYIRLREEEARALTEVGGGAEVARAAEFLDALVLSPEFPEFLTLAGYEPSHGS